MPANTGTIAPECEDALAALRSGRPILLIDEHRGRGDLVSAAQLTTAEAVNLMCTHGRGLVAIAIPAERARALRLERQPVRRFDHRGESAPSPFAAIESRAMVTTGISAVDRARTIATVADPRSTPADLLQPGHVLPIAAAEGGLLARRGRAEAAVDAVRLAGLRPAAAICEVLGEAGDLAEPAELEQLGNHLRLPLVSIGAIAEARFETEWAG